jgi:hypothetical protein
VKLQLSADVTKKLSEGASQDEMIDMVREVQIENKIPESHIARLVCICALSFSVLLVIIIRVVFPKVSVHAPCWVLSRCLGG